MRRLRIIPAAICVLAGTTLADAEEARGRWYAADAYYGAEPMAKARHEAQEEMGGQIFTFLLVDRFEFQTNDGDPLLLWDAQGWVGGPVQKFWFKTEGEYLPDEEDFEEAEVQALYSHAISPFLDVQAGFRYDPALDPERGYAVIGVEGLAPQWFEIDAATFISQKGEVSFRLEAEYEVMLTQRLILQPRTELNFAVQNVPELGIGSGLSTAEAGLRLRYQITSKIGPYVGVSWNWKTGETADFASVEGEDTNRVSFVAGLRFWY